MLKYTTFDIVFQELPDEVTLAINISGCPNRCAGCHTPELMEDRGEALTEGVLGDLLEHYGRSITAVCFMGGDNSPSEVFSLAGFVRRVSSLRVGWYSGRGTLPCDLSLFDYVKLGGYLSSLGGLRERTTNQRMYQVVEGECLDITSRFWR